MKIGILTFHRAHNYGAVLQCFALQDILKEMGYEVEVIDYRQPFIEDYYSVVRMSMLKKSIKHPKTILNLPLIAFRNFKRKKIFSEFLQKYIYLSPSCDAKHIPQKYDIYIVGSDQLWSKCTQKLDPIYYGEFSHSKDSMIYGYAISSNIPYLNTIDKNLLSVFIDNFSKLSLREQNCVDYFEKLGYHNIRKDIDPTLLTTEQNWERLINDKWKHKEYILFYYVSRKNWPKSIVLSRAQNLAESTGLPLLDISENHLSVEDFVTAFKYAKCVVTSSFHATSFSVIFERPFYTYCYKDGRDNRYVDLLNSLGLEKQLLDVYDFPTIIPQIDWTIKQQKLPEIQNSSLSYLRDLGII